MDEVYTFMAELDNNVEYQNKVGPLLNGLNEAKQRQDIMEYKDLYRQLLHKEVGLCPTAAPGYFQRTETMTMMLSFGLIINMSSINCLLLCM